MKCVGFTLYQPASFKAKRFSAYINTFLWNDVILQFRVSDSTSRYHGQRTEFSLYFHQEGFKVVHSR